MCWFLLMTNITNKFYWDKINTCIQIFDVYSEPQINETSYTSCKKSQGCRVSYVLCALCYCVYMYAILCCALFYMKMLNFKHVDI